MASAFCLIWIPRLSRRWRGWNGGHSAALVVLLSSFSALNRGEEVKKKVHSRVLRTGTPNQEPFEHQLGLL